MPMPRTVRPPRSCHRSCRRSLPAALALAAGLLHAPTYAARPLVTDDARIVDPKACQLESWLRFNRGGTERWALPGCNFTGNFEVTAGGSVQRVGDDLAVTEVVLQGKTVLKPVEPNGYGVALTFGAADEPKAERRTTPGSLFAYVPLTVSLRDDRTLLHANLGVTRSRIEGTTRMTWGVAGENVVNQRLALIAETYGENRGSPWYQLGLRVWLVPQRVQLDATYGSRFGDQRESRFVSIGLRLLSPAFLP
ncbi:hypothetical protein [Paracidovorax citrulli]